MVSGNFFCAEGYSLAGSVISVQTYDIFTVSTKAMSTYCADACRSLGTCHGFTLDVHGTCNLLSRTTSSTDGSGLLNTDMTNPDIVVGCLKHALMWADLGGRVAVAEGKNLDAGHVP